MLTSFYSKSEDVGHCGKLSGVRESGLLGERLGGGGGIEQGDYSVLPSQKWESKTLKIRILEIFFLMQIYFYSNFFPDGLNITLAVIGAIVFVLALTSSILSCKVLCCRRSVQQGKHSKMKDSFWA